jgi:hypothetical protein
MLFRQRQDPGHIALAGVKIDIDRSAMSVGAGVGSRLGDLALCAGDR